MSYNYRTGSDIATRLYPHQKKALTFLLEREKEILCPDGTSSTLWQPRTNSQMRTRSWVNIVTQREVFEEPEVCKGALLADDVRGFNITDIYNSY